MATYSRVSRLIPSAQRSARITNVVAGDEIDVTDILGRSARQIKIVPDDSSDSIDFRLNNRIKFHPGRTVHGQPSTGFETTVVSEGSHHPLYNATGDTEYLTDEGLRVDYIQIDAITFGAGGSAIEIIVW